MWGKLTQNRSASDRCGKDFENVSFFLGGGRARLPFPTLIGFRAEAVPQCATVELTMTVDFGQISGNLCHNPTVEHCNQFATGHRVLTALSQSASCHSVALKSAFATGHRVLTAGLPQSTSCHDTRFATIRLVPQCGTAVSFCHRSSSPDSRFA